jgi:hypothetical protein
MAVSASWVKYDNVPPYTKTFDNLPYMPINLTDNIQILGMKFMGSEIDYVEIFLQDEFADIYYYDPHTVDYRQDLIAYGDLSIEVARFWVYNVKIHSSQDAGTDFGGAGTSTYNNGTDGVGATLTAQDNGIFTHDTFINWSVGDKILLKDQTNSYENGIYQISILGDASTQWVLTRVTDADTENELKQIAVVSDEDSTIALLVDQASPAVDGATAITFGTTLETEADLDTNLTWTNILARSGGDMVRFVLNKTPSLSLTTDENISLRLNKRFECFTHLLVIKLTNSNPSFQKFQVRNLKLLAQFKTLLPETTPRPVRIFSEPGVPVVRDTMQVEYYLPTNTADNLSYYVTNKTWTADDKIEVFRQPSGGVRSPVNTNEFLYSGASGLVTFLAAQNPTSTITVTISRPLTQQGI